MHNSLLVYGFGQNGLFRFFHSLHTLKSRGSASSLLMLVTHCRHDDIHSSRSCAPLKDVRRIDVIMALGDGEQTCALNSYSTVSLPVSQTATELTERHNVQK